MKSFDLVLVTGNKASDKQIFQMLSGKNVIGTNIKCTTQIEQKLIKPMHFELLINKSGRITIIPLTSGMQIMQKNKKLKELDVNQCYDLEIKQSFYIERTYACYLEEAVTKKSPIQPSQQGKQSIWNLKNNAQNNEDKNKKKLKKEAMDIDSQVLSESTQSKSDEIDDLADEDYDNQEEQEEIVKDEIKRRKAPSNSSKNSVSKKIKSPNSCETTTIMQAEKKIEVEEQKTNTKQNNNNKQKKQVRVILSNCNLTNAEKNKMIKLGAVFVENQEEDFDVVVMEEFRRRAKLLIGLNKKAWIVSKGWILDCIDDDELITDFCEYLIEVPLEDQKKYNNLNLDNVQYNIQKGKGFKLFENCSFFLQGQYKNILIDELQAIIISGGGKIINNLNHSFSSDKQKQIAVIEDPKKIKNPLNNTLYVDPEYILLSTLKQQIQTKCIYNI
ncbi:BRCA1 carboxy-terminus (BRCT) domain protein (macronuclear) [Tetrahymena thermophila SB210]|uniref:BRCA1 carboxy-terminus (BRCT) domain protein n=1 Tax=Tetrahymena thermophila (strain SB210) TaxID=312017 RepID=Q23JA1_TETTS|nr:BRCA1 carboxy-terminus (BRCT) domain protein [Tetrahymena thermophila SB210]EAR96603.2 BRCA1 carboxy-terminus (BRCT) domain protein [Tetrahymena thermophila SB210]|eukprot:XP_001016848.2 BRCA1 carboxy-terminus (BRCT) domain protein [Tetrahymena thermophila SB210]